MSCHCYPSTQLFHITSWWFSSSASPSMVHVVNAPRVKGKDSYVVNVSACSTTALCVLLALYIHAWTRCHDVLSGIWYVDTQSAACFVRFNDFIIHKEMVCLLTEPTCRCVLMSYTVDLHVCVCEYSTDTLMLRYYRYDWKCPVQYGCNMAVHLVTTETLYFHNCHIILWTNMWYKEKPHTETFPDVANIFTPLLCSVIAV